MAIFLTTCTAGLYLFLVYEAFSAYIKGEEPTPRPKPWLRIIQK